MEESNQLIIIGYSGHSYTAIDAALTNEYDIVGYIDLEEKKFNPFDLKYLGLEDEVLSNDDYYDCGLHIAIGDNKARERLFNKYESVFTFPIITHIAAVTNLLSEISEGVLLASNAIINPLAKIGLCCIINTGAIIEHECIVDDFAHIAPGAVLAGKVKVGKRSFVGANAVVKQGVIIGDDVTIGAGTVVIRDVPDGMTVVGNPGRIIKSNK